MSLAECKHAFLDWAAFIRTAASGYRPIDETMCPMLFCRRECDTVESCLHHLRSCGLLADGRYLCPFCLRPEQYIMTPSGNEAGSSKATLHNSRLKRAVDFFKQVGRRGSFRYKKGPFMKPPLPELEDLIQPPLGNTGPNADHVYGSNVKLSRSTHIEIREPSCADGKPSEDLYHPKKLPPCPGLSKDLFPELKSRDTKFAAWELSTDGPDLKEGNSALATRSHAISYTTVSNAHALNESSSSPPFPDTRIAHDSLGGSYSDQSEGTDPRQDEKNISPCSESTFSPVSPGEPYYIETGFQHPEDVPAPLFEAMSSPSPLNHLHSDPAKRIDRQVEKSANVRTAPAATQSPNMLHSTARRSEQTILPRPCSFQFDLASPSTMAPVFSSAHIHPETVTELNPMQSVITLLRILNEQRATRTKHEIPVPAINSLFPAATYRQGLDAVQRIINGVDILQLNDAIALIDVALAIACDWCTRGRSHSWSRMYQEVIRWKFYFKDPWNKYQFLQIAEQCWRPISVEPMDAKRPNRQSSQNNSVSDETLGLAQLQDGLIFQLCLSHIDGATPPHDEQC